MTEQYFLETIDQKAKELQLNPLLLLSGIEGLYTFRDVHMNKTNQDFLDSLILSIFALRIGDHFHTLAKENLESSNLATSISAERELDVLTVDQIEASENPYLQSFAKVVSGKTVIRRYHEKALEVAALEIRKTQLRFENDSIGVILLKVCKMKLQESLDLDQLFNG